MYSEAGFSALLFLKDVLGVIRNGIPYLFAQDIKLVYTCRSEALGSNIGNASRVLASPSFWANDRMVEFSAEKRRTMGDKCAIPSREFKLSDRIIASDIKIGDFDLNYSWIWNIFSSHTSSEGK